MTNRKLYYAAHASSVLDEESSTCSSAAITSSCHKMAFTAAAFQLHLVSE
jgi:hypothetical protein